MITAVAAKYMMSATIFALMSAQVWIPLIIDVVVVCLLVCIGVYDLRHKIIPNKLVYTAAIFALIKMVYVTTGQSVGGVDMMVSILAGPIIAAPFALLWLVSGGRWMGLGDAKLALVIGWLLGVSAGFTAIVYAFWIGTVVILAGIFLGEAIEAFSTKNNALGIQLFRGKVSAAFRKVFPRMGLRSEIPFGPFMIIGLYAVYFTGRCLFCLHL
jgi:Flp pilus assembly protein protease CpaA